jgi:hypothetical protein
MLRGIVAVLSLCACAATGASGFDQNARVNRDALLVQEFQERVADYVKLHKQVAAQLAPLKPRNSLRKSKHISVSWRRGSEPSGRRQDRATFSAPLWQRSFAVSWVSQCGEEKGRTSEPVFNAVRELPSRLM